MTDTEQDAESAVAAVRGGNVAALTRVLRRSRHLLDSALPGHGGRTLLHIATDWPGYLPNAPETVGLLLDLGAAPDPRAGRGRGETPLHWAASTDDSDVARVLLDGGADPNAPDGSIGTPLDNAIGYNCLHVARLLVAHGVAVESLWHAAALGDLTRLEELLGSLPRPEQISQAFWHACSAGRRRTAERLLAAGADVGWVPDYDTRTALETARDLPTQRANVVDWLTYRQRPVGG